MASEEFSNLFETLTANFTTAIIIQMNSDMIYEETQKSIGKKSASSLENLYQLIEGNFNQEKLKNLLNAFKPARFTL